MLSNQTKLIDWQNLKRLALTLLFSALLHFLLLSSFDWRLIGLNGSANAPLPEEIHVELVSPPAESNVNVLRPDIVTPVNNAPRKPKPAPSQNHQSINHQSSSNDMPPNYTPPSDVPTDAGLPMPSANPLIRMAEQPAPDQKDETNPVAPSEQLPTDQASQGLTAEQLNQLPVQIDMMFDVLRNGKIGEAEVHFKRNTEGKYQLTSERRATGIAAAFVKAKDIENSEGLIKSNGLNPITFTHQFGKDGKKIHHADFNWSATKLKLQANDGSSEVNLPNGTQDMLSFMYQFMFVPPLTEMQITITNGRKLNQYTYRFEGEEEINTGLGKIKTLHIAKNSDEGEDKLELWLAIDYHYLPIKIRKIDKDNKVYEQIISTLEAK
jgi:hypothetical protein